MPYLLDLLLSTIDLESLGYITLTIFFAYVVFGLTGFGSSVVAIPFLIQLLPLHICVAIMLLFDLVTSLVLNLRNRHLACWVELKNIFPGLIFGAISGMLLSLYAPTKWILLVLGTFIIAMFIYRNFVSPKNYQIKTIYAIPLSFFGGIFTTLFGTGGPLYVIYLAGKISDVGQLRATLSTLISVTVLIRLLLFTLSGIMSKPAIYLLAAVLLPAALLGLLVGSKIHPIMPAEITKKVLWSILLLGGISVLVKAF